MIRLIPFLVALVLALWGLRIAARKVNQLALRRSRARIVGADRPGSYDWDRRTDQLKREIKRIGGPSEQRADVIAWLDTHQGVEAYVEPKTVVSALSVVFVDGDGEWRRFELAEDRFLKEVARERRIKSWTRRGSGTRSACVAGGTATADLRLGRLSSRRGVSLSRGGWYPCSSRRRLMPRSR